MTDMMLRPVQDNRLLRQGGELETTFGASMSATWLDPQRWGKMTVKELDLIRAGGTAFTEEQRIARRTEMEARWRENDMLQSELLSVTDPVRKDEIINRVQELQKEAGTQLDALTRESIEEGRMQTPEALTEEYGELGLTFDRPMATEEAKLLAQGKREEIIRDAIIQAGPQGALPTVARFGVGLAATAVDPLELASMFIPVVGPGRRAWMTAKLGRVGGRAAIGATEGLVGAAITEPFYYALSRSQQLDYTMTDALTNIGLGAVLGGGIGAGIGVFSRADVPIHVKEENAIDLFDRALSMANADKAPRVSADVALRQFVNGQSVSAFDVYRSMSAKDEISRLYKSIEQGRQLPVTSFIRDNYKIASDGEFGLELKAIGVGPQTVPGLFSKTGLNDLDNIVASEIEQILPGITRAVGEDRSYLSRQGLIDAISAEVSGEDVLNRRAEAWSQVSYLENYDNRIEDIARQADALGYAIHSPEDLSVLSKLVAGGKTIDEAFERLAIMDEGEISEVLVRNAEGVVNDPIADLDASARAEIPASEAMLTDTLEDMSKIVADLDRAGELDADMKADLAEVKDIEIKSRSYRAASEAATTCLLGG